MFNCEYIYVFGAMLIGADLLAAAPCRVFGAG
jgi:hypothetical protein